MARLSLVAAAVGSCHTPPAPGRMRRRAVFTPESDNNKGEGPMLREACLAGVLALAITAPAGAAETAATVLQKASDAMGAGSLQSIRFEGDGVGYAYGQP